MLSTHNYTIVSGLAIGVDSAAHRATLSCKGKTIAVLAHGLEEAKPKQNARLGQEILENNGAWVSEYPIGRPAQKQSFVQRNRIQVGLSLGSVIVEAAKNSGTMTQAEFCNRESRPLFGVVPEDINNKLRLNCSGTLELVSSGRAFPLRNKQDYELLLNKVTASKSMLENIILSKGKQTHL